MANGRTAESLAGESPTLGAVLGAAYVRGLRSSGVACTAKHFAAYTQETNRGLEGSGFVYSVDADERTMFEVYYAPVEAMIADGLAGVMCSYNRVNGTPACAAPELLERDLRSRLNFSGWVLSDWWAVSSPCAASRGLDQNMPGNDGSFDALHVLGANTDGEQTLRTMATRVLRGMLAAGDSPLGALAAPTCAVGCDCGPTLREANATSAAHVALAREVASSAAVLLKNEGGVLPRAVLAFLGDFPFLLSELATVL